MAKKNYKKFLPKAGSTVAVALAMTVALSTQVQATELDETELQPNGTPPVDGQESNIVLNPNEMEPAEYNDAVDQENKETLEQNQETAQKNEQTGLDNETAAKNNEELTDGKLPAPEMEVPVAPEAPNTDGMDVEEHNEAVGGYTEKVQEYEDKVDEYNGKVDQYNGEADELEKQDEERFEKEQEAYEKAEGQHEEAEQKYEADQQKQEQNDAAFDEYEQEKEAYDKAGEEYQEALDKYEESLQNGTADEASRAEYQKEKEAYDKAHADYLAALEKYSESVVEHDPGSEEYQKYLQDKAAYDQACADYLAALENYSNVVLPQYEQDSAEYQKYLQDKAAYDEAYAKYLEDLYKYNNGELSDYADRVEQSDKEKEILADVNKYNDEVKTKNEQIQTENAKLEGNIDVGVVESLKDVGDINSNVDIDAGTMSILGDFEKLDDEKDALDAAGKALATHPGKDAELGSDEYAAYLKAVADHNDAVDAFNAKVAAYNEAVAKYNAAVDKFNADKSEDSSSSTGIGTSSSNVEADWGNINIDNVTIGHIDVKYNAAASMDVTVTTDANGKETIQYSKSVTEYEVTGVYANEAAAKTNSDKYGVSYQASNSNTAVKTQSMNPYGGYEFHAGNVNGIRLDPATGKISFYATLDSKGKKEDITVSLDANSVYAKGSYYKVSNGGYLGNYRFGEKQDQKLEIVTIGGEQYYDISGHSVYVISSLTCDGMSQSFGGGHRYPGSSGNSTLTPWGLDLVLNMQTMIEIHQADNAKKVGFMTYELEKYMAADEKNLSDPGKAPEAPTFDREEVKPVEDPGKRPDAPTYDPGVFDMEKPDPVIQLERLEHLDTLDTLEEKLVILFDEPVDPIDPPANEPVVVEDAFEIGFDWEIEIPDEEVPLAAAPKTGDISALWSVLSGFSAAGMFLLGRKRKDEV